MPSLFLIRSTPLTKKEIALLPMGCFPVAVDDSLFVEKRIVAQARMRAPFPLLLKLAFEMGKAIPDASFGFEERFIDERESSEAIIEEQEESFIEEAVVEETSAEEGRSTEEVLLWHEYVDQGDFDKGLDALESALPIVQEDQIIISKLFASKDAEKMIFVCQAARKFQWKSMALKLRIGLRHEDPRVRCAVLKTIGLLAGPSLSPVVQLCTRDPDESVRKEAVKALRNLKRV